MNLIRHFCTVIRHRHRVISHCRKAGILRQGLIHDLSKFSPPEFVPGVRYFQGNRSPNAREREVYGYSSAWMHHKGRNKHHFEYWTDVDPVTNKYAPVRMPVRYAAEMFCDRVAASKIYLGSLYKDSSSLDYYRSGNAASCMHPDTAALLESWLSLLAESGEKAAFAAVRKAVKDDRATRKAAGRTKPFETPR